MSCCRHNPNVHHRNGRTPLMRRDLERRLAPLKQWRPRYLGSVGKQPTTGGRYAPT